MLYEDIKHDSFATQTNESNGSLSVHVKHISKLYANTDTTKIGKNMGKTGDIIT